MRDNHSGLYLIGETIDAKRAYLLARSGTLTQLVRGVYVAQGKDVDQIVLSHAVRIARYLYPSAYLSSASAVLLGPTSDGRLLISGRRNQRTRLRTLEIVQNEAPPVPSIATAVIGDDLGELRVNVSSPRQRFLEAFRLRSEHAGAIDSELRAQMAERLVQEHGSPRAAADAIWALARENGWYREGEGAERFLLTQRERVKVRPHKAALEFVVAWHGKPIGQLAHDGFEWRWSPRKRSGPSPVRQTTPGKLPAFIESLLPEGWLEGVLHAQDPREALRQGRRYLSNISIAGTRDELKRLPADLIQAKLEKFADAGRFTGAYMGPKRGELEETFEQNLARLFAWSETPRLSGVQIKAPMSLLRGGALVPAVERPFTHILKPAGTAGFEFLPLVEWLCLELGCAAGFAVPASALVEMPDEMPPALIVERFDIRRSRGDPRRLALEDFCSILGLPTQAKYEGTIERMARALRPISTEPESDLDMLFRRAVFAWLIADGDMHLKNLAVLKIAPTGAKKFTEVRFAPLYDAVTTRVFPGLKGDRMALKLNGKDDRLTRRDFLALAKTMGLPISEAEAVIAQIASAIAEKAATLRLPAFVEPSARVRSVEERVLEIATQRALALS